MTWSLAPCLRVLREQINDAYPNRSKASDGTIGDAAHQGMPSDHNPNSERVVCALDLTHDPANGFDCNKFLEAQLANPHPNAKYFVWEGHIYSRKYGWEKRPSSGHYKHIHISVGVGFDGKSAPGTYNDTSLWGIREGANMSADKLTKEEVIVLHEAEFGGKPGASYDWKHVGLPLQVLLADWHSSGMALHARTDASVAGKTTKLVEIQVDVDKLYSDQIAATKKVFGK